MYKGLKFMTAHLLKDTPLEGRTSLKSPPVRVDVHKRLTSLRVPLEKMRSFLPSANSRSIWHDPRDNCELQREATVKQCTELKAEILAIRDARRHLRIHVFLLCVFVYECVCV